MENNRMRKKLILPALLLLLAFLPLCTCAAVSIGNLLEEDTLLTDIPDESDGSGSGPALADYQTGKEGVLSGKVLGFERNILFNCHPAETSSDFLLIGFEGSGMNPRAEGSCIIWNDALNPYNVIDFTVANEISYWQEKESKKAADTYSAMVLDVIRDKFDGIRKIGIFAFSKGSSGVDCTFSRLKKEGYDISFIWLNDSFAVNGLPAVTVAVLNNEITLYNRYSNSQRLNPQSHNIHNLYSDRPNVDSRHIGTYHGGLLKYPTFSEELVAAIEKAISED